MHSFMRTIDQIRASRLPSNMMQFAARGALSVPAAENIEILVFLALHNKVFGDTARMTLAGWDEKASLAAAADPHTPPEVLEYYISPDNLRPKLLPTLLENPSVKEEKIVPLARSAAAETVRILLGSPRVQASHTLLHVLRSNPYAGKDGMAEIQRLLSGSAPANDHQSQATTEAPAGSGQHSVPEGQAHSTVEPAHASLHAPDPQVDAYLAEHASEIHAEGDKPFQAIGGVVDLLGDNYFPVSSVSDLVPGSSPSAGASSAAAASHGTAAAVAPAQAAQPHAKKAAESGGRRENTFQKINALDVKGRIQLALKGNKEERSILIRDGTKVVALAVLEAPKITDGEVEKFASQKNVLEAVLRQIPLKRRFMKNYIVVRNLVANPRTPLDLGLNLMKNLLLADLKNLSTNKEVSETIRKLALKTYKQKIEAANKK